MMNRADRNTLTLEAHQPSYLMRLIEPVYIRLSWFQMVALCLLSTSICSCTMTGVGSGSGQPVGDPLVASATISARDVFPGVTVMMSAEVQGGTPPYFFRWDQNAGPVEVVSGDVTQTTLTTGKLSAVGRYVFRILVADSAGGSSIAFVAVEASSPVEVTIPELAVVGMPIALSATPTAEVENATLLWSVTRGTATLDNPTVSNPNLTTQLGETVEVSLMVTVMAGSPDEVTSTQSFDIISIVSLTPQVLIATNFGSFTLELDAALAPSHVVNFLTLVDRGFYDGLLFHRNACSTNPDTGMCEPFVLQGGGFQRVDGELVPVESPLDPVMTEADNGLSNGTIYSVAYALSGNDPNSGTGDFFINMKDNSFLDNQSFTVFGLVVVGTDIVDSIVAMERVLSPIFNDLSLPAEDVIIEQMSRVIP